MPEHSGDPQLLNVPYFQQTWTATCGPACLMMVMHYWDSSVKLSRELEFHLWAKSHSMFLFGGTFQFGLATAAKKEGFKTEIYQHGRFCDGYPKFPYFATFMETLVSFHARREHIPILYGDDTMAIVRDGLHRSIPPIVFINLFPILGENVFHWVVVTGLDGQYVYMNDPYVPMGFCLKQKKDYPVSLDIFSQAMATQSSRNLRFPPCVVLIQK